MADGATVSSDRPQPRGLIANGLGALRFLVSDRLGISILLWAVVAFLLRPAAMAAHLHQTGLLAGFYRGINDPMAFSRLTGALQWLSLGMLIIIAAMAHTRWTAGGAEALRGLNRRLVDFTIPAAYALLFCAGYLVFVWTPTTTFTMITHDSFIFFDASYRILNGERPHVDFPTALGAATLYLPALGNLLAGGYAGSIELVSAPLALVIGLACAHAGMGRFPTGVTAVLVAVVFLLIVPALLLGLPFNSSSTFVEGEPLVVSEGLTHAMFYNRWCWAALIPIFAYLAPALPSADGQTAPRGWLAETLVIAALLGFLFYAKITFLIIGFGGAVVYAFLNPRPLRTLAVGGGATLAIILAIGVPSGLLGPYLADLWAVAQITAGKSDTLFTVLRKNMLDVMVACAPLGVLAIIGKFTRRDAIVGGFILVASLYTILQNAQLYDIPTLIVLAAYGLARLWVETDKVARFVGVGAFLLTAFGPLTNRSMDFLTQPIAARREEIRSPAPWASIPAMKNVHIVEREDSFLLLAKAKTPIELHDAFHLSNRFDRKESMRQGEYMISLMEGMKQLKAVMRPGDSVAALDMANPFPFLMNTRSARGSWITMDGNRTISKQHYPDPAKLFADTDHVMIPRTAILQHTPDMVMKIYDTWLTAHYEERVESMYWTRYSRRKPG